MAVQYELSDTVFGPNELVAVQGPALTCPHESVHRQSQV